MAGTMTGRAVDPPLERLYSELRRLRRKAGDVSYGDIAKKSACGLSKTTVAAIFTGQGRKKGPRWERVACVFDVLCDELRKTGVDPDKSLGTREELYQLYVEATNGQSHEVLTAPGPLADVVPLDVPSIVPELASPASVVQPGGSSVPPSLEVVSEVSWPAFEDLPKPSSLVSWPSLEDLPVPDAGPSLRLAEYPPNEQRDLSRCGLNGDPPLVRHGSSMAETVLQPVDHMPCGQASADRLRRWFGSRASVLLEGVNVGRGLSAFELGILLINKDAVQEGCYFLEQARRLSGKLALEIPQLRVGDRLCGSIVKDVCRRISNAYLQAGCFIRAKLWSGYVDAIDDTFPLAALISTRGRHARVGHQLVTFADLEVNRIKRVYWRARAREASPEAGGNELATAIGEVRQVAAAVWSSADLVDAFAQWETMYSPRTQPRL
ncbi:helix-turn-helix transcriptional regulator [Nonomuraea sp. NPDC005983]|uniref:helix-turn-helix domain-containing protein n=1 Tax=Nonomuraea sp. NPDC005983 TaxID=3155595 RepID=UPI0033A0A76E